VTHDVEHGLSESDLGIGLRAGRQELAGRLEEPDVRRLYR
jgi:hypothetical protein